MPPYREQPVPLGRVLLQFLAQVAHVHAQGSVVGAALLQSSQYFEGLLTVQEALRDMPN